MLLNKERYIKKSFFPAYWSREKAASKIFEAYENFVKSGAKPKLAKNETLSISTLTNDGMAIEMRLTNNGKIITAYPKF